MLLEIVERLVEVVADTDLALGATRTALAPAPDGEELGKRLVVLRYDDVLPPRCALDEVVRRLF